MEQRSIFQYMSAIDFVKDSIKELKRNDEKFSIRKFSKLAGFGSHAHLVMILRKKRKMNLKMVPLLSESLKLKTAEKMYFQTLIQLENSKTEEEKHLVKSWLNDLNPKKEFKILEIEQYHLIADWIHMAILTLGKIKGAEISAENIYEILERKISILKIREAIERLELLGLLIEKDHQLTPSQNSVTTKNDVSSRGAREYHKQVLNLAIDSIENQSVKERELQSFCLSIPKSKIPFAKELIRKFRTQFSHLMEAEDGDSVYQCSIQFFKLMEIKPKLNNGGQNEKQ